MLDFFCIFTTGGLLLWSKSFINTEFKSILNELIKNILMDEKKTQEYYIPPSSKGQILRWKILNELELIFVVAYQQIYNVLYTEILLDLIADDFKQNQLLKVKRDAKNLFMETLDTKLYNKDFMTILNKWEKYCQDKLENNKQDLSNSRTMRNRSMDNKQFQKEFEKERIEMNQIKEIEMKNINSPSVNNKNTLSMSGTNFQNFSVRRKQNGMKASNSGKKDTKKKVKEQRIWGDAPKKINAEIMDKYDKSESKKTDGEDNVEYFKSQFLGEADPDNLNETDFNDIDKNKAKKGQEKGGIFSRFTSSLKNYIGNKVLTKEDLAPVMNDLIHLLMEKNVAKEIAENLCESVEKGLLNTKTNSFTTITTTVKEALKSSIAKILTPKEELDVLRNALNSKKRGEPYKIVFIGVNGVGKSTNLAKVGYMLMNNGLKISIAACDNFRSGAIEQLKTHCAALNCHLFEKGYKDDPAYICKEAIEEAKREGYDVVLIDTAGRLQDNEPLMKSLAKLVELNQPDTILFVGEALTGNDSVDQLMKFNQALIDNSKKKNPRTIDGILLTKFDTVDDKVGSALTMVYITGKPIVYVGTGQKYVNLKKLNVNNVLNALFG